MKSFLKRFMKKMTGRRWVQWIAAWVAYSGIMLVFWTNKKEVRGLDILKKFLNRPAIFVFWHGRSLMMSPMARRCGFSGYVASSMHRDGLLMARIQRLFGMKSIFGSTTVGGLNVIREGLRVLGQNGGLVLTVDGPSGPRMRLNGAGCLYLAKTANAPIIPVCLTATRAKTLNTWDKFMLVKPFGKIIGDFGAPMYFDKSNPNEMEDFKKKLENCMVAQLQKLDAEIGRPREERGEKRK
jgi:lysophospholipid acyltransferase (LPLAT)-like uncharacterized protein